uniref:NADH-ubiquinone oxidoreductase chain 4 n=1 Tax=Staphylinidae sp. BMNH 1274668 TaxID=1796590 RepID=A0A140EFY8_9COLE|nr:NADH dehydrogenase subunit 4 [Staphylinidae sp. BMNH 1274668]
MMMMLIYMIFMIPLICMNFWFNQITYLLLFMLFLFNFQFSDNYMNLTFFWGMDLISYLLILLTVWIFMLMVMASSKIYMSKSFNILFLFILLILMMTLVMTFSSLNLFIFYVFFEISLIPTLLLILGWGYQPERIQAGIYLLFYTMFSSLPMLLGIFYLYKNMFNMEFMKMNLYTLNNIWIYMSFNLVFLVKFPMYMLHMWLPKAHVEAPISGSMILAGIMLKLGGYGMMRLMNLFLNFGMKFNYLLMVFSLFGGCVISLICLRQSDMKSLIAYSSVAHMSLVISGLMTMNLWGFMGSLVMMISHGLCSSGMFCLANISYERLMSRSLFINKGLMNLIPSMSMFWFLLSSSNMAAPPSLNLLGEIMLINSLISFNFYLMLMLMFMSFMSASYSLYLYSYSQHGVFMSGNYSFSMGYIREYMLLFLHWLPLNMFIMKSDLFF